MYYYRRLDRQKRELAKTPFGYSIRCALADMTVTNMVFMDLRNGGEGVSVVVVWYGRGYGAHCRRDQTNRAAVAVAATAAVVAVPPKREARRWGKTTD